MLKDQWSRQLAIPQVIDECAASGYVVDWHFVENLFKLLNSKMERDMHNNIIAQPSVPVEALIALPRKRTSLGTVVKLADIQQLIAAHDGKG
jgi:hypothetical protein